MTGTFVPDPSLPGGSPATDKFRHGDFHFALPSNGQAWLVLTTQLRGSGATYSVDKQPVKRAVRVVATTLLPALIAVDLLALVLVLVLRPSPRGAGGGAVASNSTLT
ncbi:MAG TPA: hypothetical protein VFQ85_12475 [Mycobacteriales bacterium]|nr:hypothetical protein [Mycobacteriales bacterium]